MHSPTQNLGPIGSAVLSFIGYKQTNKQTDKQTDRQAKFIYRYILHTIYVRFQIGDQSMIEFFNTYQQIFNLKTC